MLPGRTGDGNKNARHPVSHGRLGKQSRTLGSPRLCYPAVRPMATRTCVIRSVTGDRETNRGLLKVRDYPTKPPGRPQQRCGPSVQQPSGDASTCATRRRRPRTAVELLNRLSRFGAPNLGCSGLPMQNRPDDGPGAQQQGAALHRDANGAPNRESRYSTTPHEFRCVLAACACSRIRQNSALRSPRGTEVWRLQLRCVSGKPSRTFESPRLSYHATRPTARAMCITHSSAIRGCGDGHQWAQGAWYKACKSRRVLAGPFISFPSSRRVCETRRRES